MLLVPAVALAAVMACCSVMAPTGSAVPPSAVGVPSQVTVNVAGAVRSSRCSAVSLRTELSRRGLRAVRELRSQLVKWVMPIGGRLLQRVLSSQATGGGRERLVCEARRFNAEKACRYRRRGRHR